MTAVCTILPVLSTVRRMFFCADDSSDEKYREEKLLKPPLRNESTTGNRNSAAAAPAATKIKASLRGEKEKQDISISTKTFTLVTARRKLSAS